MTSPTDQELASTFSRRIHAAAEQIEVSDSWSELSHRLPEPRRMRRPRPILIAAAVAALVVIIGVSFLNWPGGIERGQVAGPAPTAPIPGDASALNGRWIASWTRQELATSPLTGEGELNDGNWGTFTLTMSGGRGHESMWNSRATTEFDFTYRVDGDVLTLDRDNGEHFLMRWKLDGDQLILTRDDNLGEVPVAYVIKPFVR